MELSKHLIHISVSFVDNHFMLLPKLEWVTLSIPFFNFWIPIFVYGFLSRKGNRPSPVYCGILDYLHQSIHIFVVKTDIFQRFFHNGPLSWFCGHVIMDIVIFFSFWETIAMLSRRYNPRGYGYFQSTFLVSSKPKYDYSWCFVFSLEMKLIWRNIFSALPYLVLIILISFLQPKLFTIKWTKSTISLLFVYEIYIRLSSFFYV